MLNEIRFHLPTLQHNFEIIENDHSRFEQSIENDVWNKVITYKINRDNKEQWVLHDFKKVTQFLVNVLMMFIIH